MTEIKKKEDYLKIQSGMDSLEHASVYLNGIQDSLESEGFRFVFAETTVYFEPKTDAV